MIVADRTTELSNHLLVALRVVTDRPALAFAEPPSALSGGFYAELLSFRLVDAPRGWDGQLVARVMPNAAIAAKETVFQSVVAGQGYPTPRVVAAGDPQHGVDGRAFMVMELAQGQPLLAGLDGIGALTRLPSLARRLPQTLATVLAALHRLDPGPVEAQLEAGAIDVPSADSALASLRAAAEAFGRPDLHAAAEWLEAYRPANERTVVCHGDMHPFNVLDHDGEVTVLDWSAALLASANYDLAFTSLVLAAPPLVVPGPLRRVVSAAGGALSRRFLRLYEREAKTAVNAESLAWHQGVICLRALVEVAQWVSDGTVASRGGHPWIISGQAFADRLTSLTGTRVSAQ